MEIPKRELSYRLYKKLTDREKNIIKKHSLSPVRMLYALFLFKKKSIRLRKAIKISESLTKKDLIRTCIKPEYKIRFVIKELLFRGFIPISEYTRYHKRYTYITSNFLYNGELLIYPKRFGFTAKEINEKGYINIFDIFNEYCLQGFTKIHYGDENRS